MRSSCPSDCCLVLLESKKTNLCSSVFILSSFNSAAFVILLFWWTASSSLVFRDRICSSLCSRERDNSLACAVTSSNLQKQKQKNRSISKYLAETNCSEETTKIDWIRSNFIFHVDPPFSNSFTRNWFDDKKSKQQHCYTELLERSGDDYPQEWPPCYRPKTVGKLFKLFGELPLQPKPLVSTLQTDQFTLHVGLILLLGFRRHIFIFLLL